MELNPDRIVFDGIEGRVRYLPLQKKKPDTRSLDQKIKWFIIGG
jgi:hypothetical protein